MSAESLSDLDEIQSKIKHMNTRCNQIQMNLVNLYDVDLVRAVQELEVLQKMAKEAMESAREQCRESVSVQDLSVEQNGGSGAECQGNH